uniref:Uncharacterized protein n=1 Tax=Avena sativa TaxID=4498 RepID=A0ACD5WI29_AVESA
MVNRSLSQDPAGTEEVLLVDYRDNPVDRSHTGAWLAALLILGTAFGERVCIMCMTLDLQSDLENILHVSFIGSEQGIITYFGILNLLALIGGFFGDAKLGRFLAIAISLGMMIAGMELALEILVPGLHPPPCVDENCVPANGWEVAIMCLALCLTALGVGGLRGNIPGFLSDQFDRRVPREAWAMKLLFSRFYSCTCLGGLFALTVLEYVQLGVGYGWGYCISMGIMILAAIVLVGGRHKYRYRKPAERSPLSVIWNVLWMAFRRRSLPLPMDNSALNGFLIARVPHTNSLRCLDKAAIVLPGPGQPLVVSATVTEVEELKLLINLLPIWVTSVLYWTIYNRMTFFSIMQAADMDRHLGKGFVIPSLSIPSFLFISVIIFTSINEPLLVPMATRLTRSPQGPTSLQRIGAGLLIATISMTVAALVEKRRIDAGGVVSAFWLVPQYFIMGAGDAFVFVGQLEFFIREGPERMKSVSTGLFLATLSVGSFLGALLVLVTNSLTHGAWIGEGYERIDRFYWMLAGLGVGNFILFTVLARRHTYRNPRTPALAVT